MTITSSLRSLKVRELPLHLSLVDQFGFENLQLPVKFLKRPWSYLTWKSCVRLPYRENLVRSQYYSLGCLHL
jgi:hypothetical protein